MTEATNVEKIPDVVTRSHINPKEVYVLRCNPDGTQNFIFSGCCSPMSGDDVLGFINDKGEVEVHAQSCPRAQVLKASFGPRILSTRWETGGHKFLGRLKIEGIDRHGILQELTSKISLQLNMDIRSLSIKAANGVFNCTLDVLVSDASIINELSRDITSIDGIQRAVRTNR